MAVRLACTILLVQVALPVHAADWPEWRGQGRRGVWTEDGILERFPEGGLAYTWRTPIGEGHAGPAVADGRIYVTDFVRAEGLKGTERALCLDERTGKVLWQQEWPVDYSGTQPRWANGPRATPTVGPDSVFVLGGMGRLLALDRRTGEIRWQHDLREKYGAAIPAWGVASAPILDGELLVALVGGEEHNTVMAFRRRTGKEAWRTIPLSGDPGYAPPILVQTGETRQFIIWTPQAIYSLESPTGRMLWSHPFEARMGLSVATPVFDAGRLLVSAFFDGTLLLAMDEKGAKEIWRRKGKSELPADSRALHALIATPVLDGDHIYGVDSYGEMRGLRASDGERLWESIQAVGEQARWAAALIVRHGDRYFINNDRGDLIIARLTPDGYHEIDRTPLIEPTSGGGGRRKKGGVLWTHPAYANRHIVVRNDREIVRASLEAPPPSPSPTPKPPESLSRPAGPAPTDREGPVARVELEAQDVTGLSGLARGDGGTLWTVGEDHHVLLEITPDGRTLSRREIAGLAGDTELESVAWLGGTRVAVGTEQEVGGRPSDMIHFLELADDAARVVAGVELRYASWGLSPRRNQGIEGLCRAGSTLLAGLETTTRREGKRSAAIGRYDIEGEAWTPLWLELTSEAGKLSALDCRTDGDHLDVIAIERHFEVARLLRFRVPMTGEPGLIVPAIVLDLAPHKLSTDNFEGIVWAGESAALLILDNSYGTVTGPNTLFRASF